METLFQNKIWSLISKQNLGRGKVAERGEKGLKALVWNLLRKIKRYRRLRIWWNQVDLNSWLNFADGTAETLRQAGVAIVFIVSPWLTSFRTAFVSRSVLQSWDFGSSDSSTIGCLLECVALYLLPGVFGVPALFRPSPFFPEGRRFVASTGLCISSMF